MTDTEMSRDELIAEIEALRQKLAETLDKESTRFRTLAENAPVGLVAISEEGYFTYANKKFIEMFGYDLSEIPHGREWFRMAYPDPALPPEVISLWKSDLAESALGELRPGVFSVTCKDGTEKIVHFRPVQLDTGEHLMTCEDITESRRTEDALRDSEERFRALSEATFEAIFLSEKGVCIGQNLSAEKMFGYSAYEALGRSGTEWIAPNYRQTVRDNMLSGLEEPYEVVALRKDGTTFPCEIQGKMLTYEGRPIRVTAVRDITERKEAQADLRSSEQRFRTLIETMNEAFGIQDENGVIKFVNERQCEMLGYSREELIGSDFSQFLDEESRGVLSDQFDKRKEGQVGSYEVTFVRKDGSRVNAIVSGTPVFNSEGVFKGSFGVATDITERKKVEEILRTQAQIVTQVRDSIVTTDLEGRITSWNRGAKRLHGFTEEEVLGKPISMLFPEEHAAMFREIAMNIMDPINWTGG